MWTRGWVLAVGLVLIVSAAAVAADSPAVTGSPDDRISLELKDVEIRAAIEALFRNTGKNFFIDPQVSGMVPTVSFKDVTFDTALRNLTRSAGLVYRKDGEVYIIAKKPDTTTTEPSYTAAPAAVEYLQDTTTSELRVEKVSLNYSSPSEILAIMRGDNGNSYAGNSGTRYDGGYYSRGYGGYGQNYGGYSGGGNVRYGGYNGYGYGGNYGGNNYGNYGGGYGRGGSGYGNYGNYGGGSYRGW